MAPSFARRFLLLGCAAFWLGCGSGADGDAIVSDASEVSVQPAELGGSYRFSIEPAGGKVTNASVTLLRVSVPADTTFAAVMRRSDGSDLDAFLALYPAERAAGESDAALATSKYDQAVLPMAAEPDAVLVHRTREARDFLLFASDVDLDVWARFQIDLLPLAADPGDGIDLTLTNPAVRKLTSLLREDEPHTAELAGIGAVEEGGDGLLIAHPLAVASLKQRAELNAFVAGSNDVRMQLFEEHARAVVGEPNAEAAQRIGSTCGALWGELRSEAHALGE